MSSKIRLLLIVPALLLGLNGCTRFAMQREVVWAKMGTPAKIVDDRLVDVLVPDGDGGWQPGRANLAGMVAVDEPTLDYLQSLETKE